MSETYTSQSQWLERDINKARQQSTLRSAITTTSAKKKSLLMKIRKIIRLKHWSVTI